MGTLNSMLMARTNLTGGKKIEICWNMQVSQPQGFLSPSQWLAVFTRPFCLLQVEVLNDGKSVWISAHRKDFPWHLKKKWWTASYCLSESHCLPPGPDPSKALVGGGSQHSVCSVLRHPWHQATRASVTTLVELRHWGWRQKSACIEVSLFGVSSDRKSGVSKFRPT